MSTSTNTTTNTPCWDENERLYKAGTITTEIYIANLTAHFTGTPDYQEEVNPQSAPE
jgi:hypothetical protein